MSVSRARTCSPNLRTSADRADNSSVALGIRPGIQRRTRNRIEISLRKVGRAIKWLLAAGFIR